jgi:hypothetical protein
MPVNQVMRVDRSQAAIVESLRLNGNVVNLAGPKFILVTCVILTYDGLEGFCPL